MITRFTWTYHSYQDCSSLTPEITGPNLGLVLIPHAPQIKMRNCKSQYSKLAFIVLATQPFMITYQNFRRIYNEEPSQIWSRNPESKRVAVIEGMICSCN